MPERLLIDTDVLVDYLRGHPQAVRYRRAQKGPLALSAITVAVRTRSRRRFRQRVRWF